MPKTYRADVAAVMIAVSCLRAFSVDARGIACRLA
jgi:hypothetical protein